jgi:calcium permeable stress-gated cation channel
VRQDYLTSAEHRLKASATTVLVSAIPKRWLSEKALMGLYDVFPGGIRNIWINRNYDELLKKVHERDEIVKKLEKAETQLIQKCKKVQLKQAERDEKNLARKSGAKSLTKEERAQKQKIADGEASRMAQGDGISSGDPHQVRHTVEDAVDEEDANPDHSEPDRSKPKGLNIGAVGQGLGRGLGRGLGAIGGQFGKVGQTIIGGARNVGRELDDQLEFSNGFIPIDSPETPIAARFDASPPRQTTLRAVDSISDRNPGQIGGSPADPYNHSQDAPTERPIAQSLPDPPHVPGDRTPTHELPRKGAYKLGSDGADDNSDNWIRFWRGPAVGYPSPKPHGFEEDEYPLDLEIPQTDGAPTPRGKTTNGTIGRRHQRPTTMDKVKAKIQSLFKSGEKPPHLEYPRFFNPEYKEDVPAGALWEKYIKKSDRPTHRLPRFGGFLPTLPFINKKVDTIYWCREELARLNVEIEEDQNHPERYPSMNSAFIQFNHQVAAHMASQAVSHHIPKQMTPRLVEISPTDVIWDNMSIRWWEEWVRTFLVLAIVTGMTILWAVPVAGTALLGNLPALIQRLPWLSFLNSNDVVRNIFNALGGVLPALALTILLALVPIILYYLATVQGVQTGMQKELTVQNYLFAFNFVQIFLVVSIASGALYTLQAAAINPTSIPKTLATNLPKAANYFFSYLILQALGNSSGALLQYVTLALWFVFSKFDVTARDKWRRNTQLSVVNWGSYFPLYTTFACIALIYSVVAPMILIFAIITFSLYWIANRYCMLYIFKNTEDTGGLLYPRAINQTFVGIYFMELCLIGLFFIVEDSQKNLACTPQAIIMTVVTVLTALYQILLNQSFGPLFRHLPITLEDDAVLRDEAFARAQAARWEQEDDEEEEYEEQTDTYNQRGQADPRDDDIEMKRLSRSATSPEERRYNRFDPRSGLRNAGTWAIRGTAAIKNKAFGRSEARTHDQILQRRHRRHKDLEAQKKIGQALFGGIDDEIEDLTPHERDALVNHAFKHEALRARRPTVWIPRDDLGISDEEIRRTEEFSAGNIWISNEGTALDSKCRVVYGRNPPDFSNVDLIKL